MLEGSPEKNRMLEEFPGKKFEEKRCNCDITFIFETKELLQILYTLVYFIILEFN